MSQDHIDHAYACGTLNNLQTHRESVRSDSASSSDDDVNSESTTIQSPSSKSLTASATDFQTKKVVVESVDAADLGAVHENLINSSPNKHWYMNDRSKSSNGAQSSSSTETGDSEAETRDDVKEHEDETDGVVRTENNQSPTEEEYTPMSPLDEGEYKRSTVREEELGVNLLKETNVNELGDSHVSEKTDLNQETEVNGTMQATDGDAQDSEEDKEKDVDKGSETETDDEEQDDLNSSNLQNVTQNSEQNASFDTNGEPVLDDSVEQTNDAESILLSPTTLAIVRRKGGRRSGKRRKFGRGWSRTSPRTRSVDSKGGTPVKEAGSGTEESLMDTPTTGSKLEETDERLRRRSKTPSRQNPEEFLVGDEAVDEVVVKVKKPERCSFARTPKHQELTPELIEQYSEPLKNGWRREVVLRGVWDDIKSRNPPVDVYYHPPSGTGPKLRSMVGIAAWLSKYDSPLNGTNFTFMRRPIGAKEGEEIRQASLQRGRASSAAAARKRGVEVESPKEKGKKRKPEIVIERDSEDMISPLLEAEDMFSSSTDSKSQKINTIKKDTKSNVKAGSKEDGDHVEEIGQDAEKVETLFPSSEAVIISPPKKKFKPTARKSTTQKFFKKPKPKFTSHESLCTLTCPGLEGISPLLRCNVCMCLFHPQCVNFKGDLDKGFLCLRCVDLCNTVPQDTTVVMEDGIMRVPDPTTFDSIEDSTSSPVPIKLTKTSTSLALPNFSNLLSPVITAPGSVSKPQAAPSSSEMINHTSSPITIRVSTPAALKGWANTQIKQEPMDQDYPDEQAGKGPASLKALGSLKNVINTRIGQSSSSTPVLASQLAVRVNPSPQQPFLNVAPASFSMSGNLGGQVLNTKPIPSRTLSSPLYSSIHGKGLPSNLSNSINPATGLPSSVPSIIQLPVVNSLANNSILQTNSGIKLVPIGPPVKLTNGPIGVPPTFPGLQLNSVSMPQPLVTAIRTSTKSTVTTSSVSKQSISVTMSSSSSSSLSIVSASAAVTADSSKSKTVQTIINTSAVCAPKNGQLLTLPPAVVKKITPNKPLQLKINNVQLNVPPSGFFMTNDGLKVFVPPKTFPTADVDFCFSVTDDKATDSSSDSTDKTTNKSDQNTDIDKNSHSDKVDESSDSTKKAEEVTSPEKTDIRRSSRYGKCCHIHKLYGGYDCMQYIFRLLNIRDLISVGIVCRTWRMLSRHPLLWKEVKFKDVKVSSWEKAMQFLATRKVEGINFLGLLHYDEPNRTWHQLISSLQDLTMIKTITFGIVPATVLHSICERLSQLETLIAESVSDFNNETMWNRPTKLDIGKFACLTGLQELRLKGLGGLSAPSFSFSGGLPELGLLKNLEKLSIVSLRSVPETQFHFMSQLTQLQELSVGDCNTWTSETFFQLGKLTNLKFLSLEHGGEIPDVGLGDALLNMKQLERLELKTYTIADSLGGYLKQLPKLRTLFLLPDNCFLPAEVNTNTLTTVSELTFLEKLDWAIPSSFNNSIILDNNDNTEAISQSDDQQWIPFHAEKSTEVCEEELESRRNAKRQTEYIQLHELVEKVSKFLPTTKTKVYCLKPEDSV